MEKFYRPDEHVELVSSNGTPCRIRYNNNWADEDGRAWLTGDGTLVFSAGGVWVTPHVAAWKIRAAGRDLEPIEHTAEGLPL